MPRFLKIVFGSCLGSLLAIAALFFFFSSFVIASITGLVGAGSSESTPSIESNSVMYLDFPVQLTELTNNSSGSTFDLKQQDVLGLHDIIAAIEQAAEDDDIKGIYLKNNAVPASFTSVRQLRNALLKFKESGKFIVAYSGFYNQAAYYMATAADELYVGPLGLIDFRGIGVEIPFYKNLMDKAGVKMEVFYAGNFKSATEPFRRTEISEANRIQTRAYLSDIFRTMASDMDASRQLNNTDFRTLANDMTGWDDNAALEAGMVDAVLRRSEMNDRLQELLGLDADDKIEMISSTKYHKARVSERSGGTNEVAVLIAEGNIVDGRGELGSIGDKKYVKAINDLADDDDVKAMVLRINSGGGSASSSENIWYAIEQFKETGKPVVVSMGDFAASGGYYMATGADSIIAEQTTLTGSIGVFTMFPNLKELMNDRIGINYDTINITRNANALSSFQDMSPEARKILERRTENVYLQFMQRVSEGRGIPLDQVKKIAQGRVYSGEDALEIQLVDKLGNLDDAIAAAAKLADLDKEDYGVQHYPAMLSPLEQFLNDVLDLDPISDQVSDHILRQQLGEEGFKHYNVIRAMNTTKEPQAALPIVINF